MYLVLSLKSGAIDILVVCEFPDVFLDELPGLPPDRDDMNFSSIHVIHDDCSFCPNKENQIPFRVNCNRCVG